MRYCTLPNSQSYCGVNIHQGLPLQYQSVQCIYLVWQDGAWNTINMRVRIKADVSFCKYGALGVFRCFGKRIVLRYFHNTIVIFVKNENIIQILLYSNSIPCISDYFISYWIYRGVNIDDTVARYETDSVVQRQRKNEQYSEFNINLAVMQAYL